jgi:hypothetical protein
MSECKIPCKALFFFFSILLFITFTKPALAQTPVTTFACDPRSTANGGVCPTDCNFPVNVEKGCNCFDNIDNDGDGNIDIADIGDCAQYWGLGVSPGTSNCSIVPPAGGAFAGLGAPVGSQQNTADTQSKVAVGDVDNDGIPDAVITSKWGNEIRVVATTNGQPDGTKAGSVKADYNLSGKKGDFPSFGGCTPNRLLVEHEVLIADIDRAPNGRAEIFAVISNRGGNPKTPPTCFYLIGLRYNNSGPGGLELLYPPVPLGVNRPGIFGIADMDGDGKAEIYLRDRIYAAETGKLLASEGAKTALNTALWDVDVTSGPAAVNVTGDNKMELICGTRIYSIPSLTNRNPAAPSALTLVKDMNVDFPATKCFVKLMNDPTEYGEDTHSTTSVADIDGDGFIDIVISGALNSSSGRTAVFYWNVQKNTVSYKVTPNSSELGFAVGNPNYTSYLNGWIWGTGRVNIGDANGDGKSDFTFLAGNQLFCLTTDGSGTNLVTLWTQNLVNTATGTIGYRTVNDSRSGVLTATIYDFDNDGNPEMVYRDSQTLNVIDGATGTNLLWSVICQSHTYTEGPVIADVNGDGATDICVTCNTSKSFDINDDIQQQALGQVRLYFSNTNNWLPTRKVWNQPGYFVVNINDDLTLPFPQLDQNLIFSNAPCPNGLPGPQRPLNVFLNQVPYLNANGCPIFPSADLTFIGQDPATADPNSPNYFPAVVVTPPICGNLDIGVVFNIGNTGEVPITDNVPVSFFNGDPRLPGAIRLFNTNIAVNNLSVGDTLTTSPVLFNGPGVVFDLYIALYNDGSVLPIPASGQTTKECEILNNVYRVQVVPSPFTAQIAKFRDNEKCIITDPDAGELRARIFKGVTEVFDFSPYAFQWYAGIGTANPIAAAQGGQSPIITGLAEGDYTLVITNTQKGCSTLPVSTNIISSVVIPEVTIALISDQTQCNPPNGRLEAQVTGGNTGFTFEWFSTSGQIGINTPVADGLVADNYSVLVTRNGCTNSASRSIQDFAVEPDAQAVVVQNVVNCTDLNSGTVTGSALLAGVEQNPAEYTFNWYFYNNVAGTRGSILPVTNGTGPTRTGLAIGFYQLEVIRNSTQCVANQSPIVEITDSTILPEAVIIETLPLTSCDPANPNGVLTASVLVNGVPQNSNDYTFEWFKGDNTLIGNLHTTVSGNGTIAEKVAGGGIFYTVKVTNKITTCSDTEKRIITEDVNVPVVTLSKIDNGICDPALASASFNGSVTASVTFKGSPVTDFTDYSFNWFDGSQVTDPTITPTPANPKNPILNQLDGGYYTVVVNRLSLGCNSIPVTAEVINTAALPAIATNAIGSTNCEPSLANGQALVTNVDGTGTGAPYIFQWHTGNTIASPIATATSATLSSQQGGPTALFTVLVTNQTNGCQNTATVQIPDNRIIPDVSLSQTPNSICDASLTNPSVNFNGSVSATVNNLIGLATNYVFTWRNGQLISDPINATSNTANLINVNSGYYNTTVLHTPTGCVSPLVNIQVLDITTPPAIATSAVPSTNCSPALANGQALVNNVDGAGTGSPYIFQWHSGSTLATPIAGATNATLTNQNGGPAAFFTVQVTNQSNGCQSTATVQIPDNRVIPDISLIQTPNTICNVALTNPAVSFNGAVTATVNNLIGTLANYTFTWRNGQTTSDPVNFSSTTQNLSNLNSGYYTTTVLHTLTGCVSPAISVQVQDNTVLPDIATSAIGSTNCDPTLANGQALVSNVDNAGVGIPYVFQWHTGNNTTFPIAGATGAVLSNQNGGPTSLFTVRVINQSNGCQNTASVQIPDNQTIPILSLTQTANDICDATLTNPAVSFNGRVDATIAHPDVNPSNFVFSWFNGQTVSSPPNNTSTNQNLINIDKGYYTARTIHTPTGCVSPAATIEVLSTAILPVIATNAIASTNCVPALANGQALVTSVDGVGVASPYIFQWFDGITITSPISGATNPVLANRQGGLTSIFTVQVTNQSNGCQNTATVQVPNNESLPIITLTSTANENCIAPFSGSALLNTITYKGVAEAPAGYSFEWKDNTNTVIGNTSIASALNNGAYSLTVIRTDVGCTSDPVQVDVLSNIFNPQINVAINPQTSCDSANPNGQLIAVIDETSIGNGNTITTGYTFNWVNNGNPFTPIGPAAGNTSTLNNLSGNLFYTVNVERTSTRCTNSQSVFLPEQIKLPRLELVATDILDCTQPGSVEAKVFIDKNNDGDTNDPGDELSAAEIASDYTIRWFRGSIATGPQLAFTGKLLTELAPGIPLPADNYTAIAVNNITFCETSDFTDVVNGPGPLFDITSEINKRPSSCELAEGVVTAIVEVGGVPQPFNQYTFEWFSGNPTNPISATPPSFYTDPQVQFTLPVLDVDQNNISGSPIAAITGSPQLPDAGNLSGPTLFGRPSSTYSVVVTRDSDGCKEYKSIFLPYVQEPVIILAEIKPDDCLGDNGAVDVDLQTIQPASDYKLKIFNGSNPVLATDTPLNQIDPAAANNNLFGNLASGIYTVVAQENFGSQCYSSPLLIQLIEALPPVVDILGSTANTSCVAAPAPGDGGLEIRVNTNTNDPFSASYPALPPPASIDKGAPPFVTYSIDVKDAANGIVPGYPTAFTFEDGDSESINGLRGETYTITVTSSKGCFTTKTFDIPNTPIVPNLDSDVIILPALACDPALETNASVEIKSLAIPGIGVDNISDYQFDWFTNPALTINILSANGDSSPAKGGEILSNTVAPLPTAPVGAGSYWVRATKVNVGTTGGIGCLTAPLKVDIDDQSINPTAVINSLSNTACDADFEGSLNVEVTDAGSIATATYNYTWTSPALSPVPNGLSDGDGNLTDDNFVNLSDGTYVLSVRNNTSGCVGTAQTTILKAATPIVIANATAVDQFICNPDGSIVVGPNDIVVGGLIDPVHANFDFTWARNTVGNIFITPPSAGIDAINTGNLPTIGAGSYFVSVKKRNGINPGSGCESVPFRVDIMDKSVDPTVTLTPFSNTACDVNFEGAIQVNVTNPGSAPTVLYNYVWNSTPTIIVNGTGDGNGTGIDDNFASLRDGNYSITVQNTVSGCFGSAEATITKEATPIVITGATAVDQLLCNPDGSILVGPNDIQVGGVIDPNHANFDFTWSRNTIGNTVIGPSAGVDVINNGNLPTIGAGSYFVKVKKIAGLNPGSGCESAPFRVDILDKHIDPTVVLSATANTACDTNFEGAIQVTVTNPGSAASPDYNYTWTTTPVASPILNSIGNGNGLDPDDNFGGLSQGTYAISVRNNTSGCFGIAQTIITNDVKPIVFALATATNQLICNPDGSVVVGPNDITIDGVVDPDHNNFEFTWSRTTLSNIVIGPAVGVDAINTGNLANIGADSYFIQVRKRPGFNPGSGCASAPFRVEILDRSIDPTVVLTPFSNTACDTNFEGAIQVRVTNAGSAPTASYNYSWNSTPTFIANGVSDGDGNNADDNFSNLSDGSYSITVQNTTSGCFGSSQAIITKEETPIVVANATPINQLICNPDGSITVGANDILVGGVIDPVHTNFDFTWSRNTIGNIVVGPAAGIDAINVGNFPSIGADAYFVKVKKLPGAGSGSGCESAPFKVDIKDLSEDPTAQFNFIPNSSCNINNPNGEVTAIALERNGNTDTYTFSWTLNTLALPGTITQTDGPSVSDLTNAPEGSYSVTVSNTITGCTFISGVNVNVDLSKSIPNIISINKFEPTTCIGDGSAEVVGISIGGNPTISGPAIAPPNFEYEWYESQFTPSAILGTTTPLLTPIKNGKYFVVVKDLLTDCKSEPSEVELKDVNIIYPTIEITLTIPQISCDQTVFGTGVLVSTADNQNDTNPNYTFEWFPNLNANGTSFASTSTITGLKSGDYSLTASNLATGCSKSALYIVPDNSPQFLPQLITSSFARTLCVGQDGSIQASIVNISQNYPFPLSYTADLFIGNKENDPTLATQTPDFPNLPNVPGFAQNFSSPNNLPEGFYTARVRDNNTNCIAVKAEEIKDARDNPEVVIVEESPFVNCDILFANGQLFATADGSQITGYLFDWYSGSSIGTGATPILINNSRLVGQIAGDYTVRVTNELTGCVTDQSGKISDARVFPPAPTALVIRDKTNCLVPNGEVFAHVNCVTIAHEFNWYNGSTTKPASDFVGASYFDRAEGSYTVTATDKLTGCVSQPTTVTVKDATLKPLVTLSSTPEVCILRNGTAILQLNNGESNIKNIEVCGLPLTIDLTVALTDINWYNSSNTLVGIGAEATNLEAGLYTVEFTSSEGCSGSAEVEVATEILSYNLVSVNGDNKNDVWIVDCLEKFPENNVKVFNRSGIKVYEADGYNNADVVFKGIGERGVYALGNELPDGTYFYIIDKRDGSKPITGYLELVR